MAEINTGKLIAGGLAAGLVVNVGESVVNLFILTEAMDAMLAARNLPPVVGAAIGGYVVLAFALGLLLVWTYAAIRPRYGPGPATSARAGVAVWAAFYLLAVGSNWLMGIVSGWLYVVTMAYTLPTVLAASYVGAMVYKEE